MAMAQAPPASFPPIAASKFPWVHLASFRSWSPEFTASDFCWPPLFSIFSIFLGSSLFLRETFSFLKFIFVVPCMLFSHVCRIISFFRIGRYCRRHPKGWSRESVTPAPFLRKSCTPCVPLLCQGLWTIIPIRWP